MTGTEHRSVSRKVWGLGDIQGNREEMIGPGVAGPVAVECQWMACLLVKRLAVSLEGQQLNWVEGLGW